MGFLTGQQCSPTYNDVWGEEAEKLYEQPFLWIDSIIEEDKEKVRSCIPETITKDIKEIIFPDYRIKKSDGAIIWISARAFPIFDSEGNPHRIVGIAEDITERKQAEEQLQDSELWMKGIFAALGESVLVVTPDRRLVNTNPAVLHMFGYTHEELSNRSTEILHVDHEHFLEFGRRIQDAFDKGEPAHFEFEAKRKGDEIFPTEHTVSLLKDERGEVKGIVSVVRDITERKQAEDKVTKMNEQLRQLYSKQQQVLENERKAISREIHDELGQLLSALMINLDWTSDNIDDKAGAVERINEMTGIVAQTIQKVQRISSSLRPDLLDNLGLIPAMEYHIQEFEKRTGIKCLFKSVGFEYADDNINIVLYRILQESLTNVMRHAESKNVFINICQADDLLTLEVIDDGIGFNLKKLDSRESLGFIGIRERLKPYNGKLEISSVKDKGTKLSVSIPIN